MIISTAEHVECNTKGLSSSFTNSFNSFTCVVMCGLTQQQQQHDEMN